jgi:Ni/Co efflux regulator RcnB
MDATCRARWPFLLIAGCVLAASALAAPPAAPGAAATPSHKAKKALGDGGEFDVHANPVGVGTHMGARATAPGIFFDDKRRRAVHDWFVAHPPKAAANVPWAIGQPLPAGTPVQPVPAGLLGALPKQPRGYRYLAAGNNVLLVAAGSNMVVDGISGAWQ